MEQKKYYNNENEEIIEGSSSISYEIETVNNERPSIMDNKEYSELSMNDVKERLISDTTIINIEKLSDDKKVIKRYTHKYWVDALRVLSNYLVIMVHCSFYVNIRVKKLTPVWNGAMFWDAISRSCVPLFIMISGIFFLDPDREIPISKIYKKNVFRIFRSLLFWNIFYAVFVKLIINPFNNKYTYDSKLLKTVIDEIIFGKFHLWYLYMCIGLYIMIPIIRPITMNKTATKYYIILGMGVLSFISFITMIIKDFYSGNGFTDNIRNLTNKMMIYINYGYSCYFILGYYLSKVEIKSKIKLFLIYALGLISLYGTYKVKITLSYRNKKEQEGYTDYNSFNVVVSTIAIFIFFKETFNKILEKMFRINGVKKLLKTLSNLSFGSYLIHIFFFELFYLYDFKTYTTRTFITIPFYTTIVWLSCNITIFIVKKIPLLKYFV